MPRKTGRKAVVPCAPSKASMRPRPDAAENQDAGQQAVGGRRCASMRPRPDAAENKPDANGRAIAAALQ